MAPTDGKMKSRGFKGDQRKPKGTPRGVQKKRTWVPEHKAFRGNIQEGQGFAMKRKEKLQHEYNKLLRKEEKKKKKKEPETGLLYEEEYPEHLRHLYVAEAEKLKKEAWTNRMNRSKLRMKGREAAGERDEDEDTARQGEAAGPEPDGTSGSEPTGPVAASDQPTADSVKESLPMSNRMRKKMLKKTSYQKTKEQFETAKEKRKKKKEEYLKDKQQREEAIQRYKQKKMETFQMLSKKTKKGQPNLNLQMEYLLQKIQGTGK